MSVLQMPVAVQPDIQPRLAEKQGLSWGTADCRKALLAGISAHLLSPRPAQSACMPQAESLKSFLPLYRCYGGPKACQTDAASCTGEIKVSHTQQNYCMRIEGLSCHRKGSQTQKALPGKLRSMKLVTEHKASPSSLPVRFLQDRYVFSCVGRQPLWHAPCILSFCRCSFCTLFQPDRGCLPHPVSAPKSLHLHDWPIMPCCICCLRCV